MIYHRKSEDNVFWIVYGYAKTCDEDHAKYNLILRLTKTYLSKSGLNNKILSQFNSLLLNANSCVHFSVPPHWVRTTGKRKCHVFRLSAGSKEYNDVEAAFHATAPNQIVSIERIQNEEIYGLFNLKRQAMMKKYGSNFPGKEKMLFHGTSCENVEKINAGGLNRSYSGIHGKSFTPTFPLYLEI